MKVLREIGDLSNAVLLLHQKGILLQKMGNFNKAKEVYEDALETNQKIGDIKGEGDLLESLGKLEEAQQSLNKAEEYYKASLEIAAKIDNRRGACNLYVDLGKLAQKSGKKQDAINYYSKYIELAKKMGLYLSEEVIQEYDKLRSARIFLDTPIPEKLGFFGRKKELEEFYYNIHRQKNVMLIGERGMGKTSLLYQLHQRLKFPLIPVFVSLRAVPNQTEGILNEILRSVIRVLLKKELISSERWKNYSITYANDFVKALESILAEAKEKSSDINVVLELDEAEKIIEAGAELGNILRATLQINQEIVAILAGTSRLLTPVEDQYESPLQNIFKVLILKPFSLKETEELIRGSSEQVGVSYGTNAMERIYELGGGSPLYYNVICNHLIFTAKEKGRYRITVEDVNNIVSDVLEDKAVL